MAPSAMLVRQALPRATGAAILSTSTRAAVIRQQTRGYATPKGPPPQNFRTSRPVEWHWDKDSMLDRLGKYFLMTEMARGMYVLLEQFFRPPYVFPHPASMGELKPLRAMASWIY